MDVFAVLISNWKVPGGIDAWNWRLGDGVSDDYPEGMREFKDPARFSGGPERPGYPKAYPKHWDDYWRLDDEEDKGGVHYNSGIRNYAAYRVMTAKAQDSAFLFTPQELAAMFYVALSQHLSRQATFAQSRRAVVLAARSLFRKLSAAELTQRVRAIEHAFWQQGSRSRRHAIRNHALRRAHVRARRRDDHFERMPIQAAWLFFVLPSLSINSFGEGTLVLLAGCVDIFSLVPS